MARRYPFLAFQSGVDFKDVDPRILSALNRLAMARHITIDITSGYRTREHQAEIWARSHHGRDFPAAPPGLSQHESGNAVDATVGGTPIAKALGAKLLQKYGLDTIYNEKGMFDPVHVQLAGTTQTSGATGAATPAAYTEPAPTTATPMAGDTSQQDAAQPPPQPLQIPDYQGPGSLPQPYETVPQLAAPGSMGLGISSAPEPAKTWQDIASQPGADPLTQQIAQQVATAGGG